MTITAAAAGKTQVVDVKRRKSLIVFLVSILMLAGAIIYFDTKLLDHVKQTSQQQENQEEEAGGDSTAVTEQGLSDEGDGEDGEEQKDDDGSVASDTDSEEDQLNFSENVPVSYNSPEYDISVQLCENKDKRAFLKLRYYKDGATVENELDEGQIPELADIFGSRGGNGQSDGTQQKDVAFQAGDTPYSIGQALLNPVHGQLYLMVNGAGMGQYVQSSFYVIDLGDMSVKKLFSYPAKYGKMYFNRDFSLLAYSFSDPPNMNVYQEESIVEVLDCANLEFLIRGSRKPDNSIIGRNSAEGFIYDYAFEGWHTSGIIKLIREKRPEDDTGVEPVQMEVLYDIAADLLLNLDGTELSEGDSDKGGDSQGMDPGGPDDTGSVPGDEDLTEAGDPVEQLMSFYRYLGSDADYHKAMLMLGDDFVLRMGILTQFGVSEIHKSDIDAQGDASMYAELLRAARFDSLADVQMPDENTAVISYQHAIGLTAESQFSQLMKARMERRGTSWVITLIEDGNQ